MRRELIRDNHAQPADGLPQKTMVTGLHDDAQYNPTLLRVG